MRRVWTPAIDDWLLTECKKARDAGFTPDFVALGQHLGVSADAVRMRETAARRRQESPPAVVTPRVMPAIEPPPNIATFHYPTLDKPRPDGPLARPKDVHDVLTLPVLPLDVPRVMRPELRTGGRIKTALVFTDTHVPYQDEAALAVIESIMVDCKPDKVIHLGDLLDCYAISDFDKDPNRTHRLQAEIDGARVKLAQWRDLAPQAEMHLLEGNHEQRLQRTIWRLPGGAAELARLTAFQNAMEWPHLLGLPEMHWNWVPVAKQRYTSIIPKLLTKHGTRVSSISGSTARAEHRIYGRSGLSGHVHRMASFFHNDDNGTHSWHEIGCSCVLAPEWALDANWQQGCAVVSYTDHSYHVDPVYIRQGVTSIWRGQEYQA